MYAIRFPVATEVDGLVVNQPGTKAWVRGGEHGPTSSVGLNGEIPEDVMIFKTEAAAKLYFRRWRYHPWYNKPVGDCEIVRIKPRHVVMQKGWEEV